MRRHPECEPNIDLGLKLLKVILSSGEKGMSDDVEEYVYEDSSGAEEEEEEEEDGLQFSSDEVRLTPNIRTLTVYIGGNGGSNGVSDGLIHVL